MAALRSDVFSLQAAADELQHVSSHSVVARNHPENSINNYIYLYLSKCLRRRDRDFMLAAICQASCKTLHAGEFAKTKWDNV